MAAAVADMAEEVAGEVMGVAGGTAEAEVVTAAVIINHFPFIL